MANAFLRAQTYANTMLYLVKNSLVMGRLVNTRYKNEVTDENGLSVSVKRPPRFVATDGEALQVQDNVIGRADVAVDQYKGVHIGIGDLEYIQDYNQLVQNETMMSAASTLAQAIDSHLHTKTLRFSNWVGTPGVAIASPRQFNEVAKRLDKLAVPDTNRSAVLYTDDAYGITNTLIDNNSLSSVADAALKNARIPLLSSTKAYSTQTVQAITTGTRATSGATLVNGAGQNVNYRDVRNTMTQSLVVDGLTAGHTVKAGEVLTIANVFAVNPRDQIAYEYPQQFAVTQDATANGSGQATLTITPPIIVPGSGSGGDITVNTAFATVNAAPADNAAVTYLGAPSTTYRFSTAFHKQAITMVFAKLQKPFTGVSSFAVDPESGVSIRYWRGSDISTGKHYHRWDCVFGASNMDPLLGSRVSGSS